MQEIIIKQEIMENSDKNFLMFIFFYLLDEEITEILSNIIY